MSFTESTPNTAGQPWSLPQHLTNDIQKEIDSFLARVERFEYRSDDISGNSAQLQCAIAAVELYLHAFSELPDDVEAYWNVLVGVTSRLQAAPALRMLFSNIGKRVQRYWMEAIKQCEADGMMVASPTAMPYAGSASFAASSNNNQRPFGLTSSVSYLHMDAMDDAFGGGGGGGGGGPTLSPETASAMGQFPNMQRVPTAAFMPDGMATADFTSTFGAGNAGGVGSGAGGTAFTITEAIENIEMMTPAAIGRRYRRGAGDAPGGAAGPTTGGGGSAGGAFAVATGNKIGGAAASRFSGGIGGHNNNNNNNSGVPGMGLGSRSISSSGATVTSAGGTTVTAARPRRRFIPIVGARDAVQDALLSLKEDLMTVTQRISHNAHYHVHNDETILAFGCTNTLVSFFRQAAQTGVRFHVLLIDTANGIGGRSSLESERGMTVERLSMANCYSVMSRVNKVFLSCEAVFANGGLVAFAGSHAVCLAAKLCTVPVICVVASLKFSESFPSDSAGTTLIKVDQQRSVEWREFGPPSDVLPPEFGSAIQHYNGASNNSHFNDHFDSSSSSSCSSSSSSSGSECSSAAGSSSDSDDVNVERGAKGTNFEKKGEGAAAANDDGTKSNEVSHPRTADISTTATSTNDSTDGLVDMSGAMASPNTGGNVGAGAAGIAGNPNDSSLHILSGSSTLGVNNSGIKAAAAAGPSRRERIAAAESLRRRLRKQVKRRVPVQVWNPLNEYVPPDCVSMFVTELREITPALVQVFVDHLNEPCFSKHTN